METSVNTHSPVQRLPPGPATRLFGLDHLMQIQGTGFFSFVERMVAYGDVSCCALGPYRLYLLNHPDLVHEVLVTQADKMQKWSVQKRVVGQVIGQGTFNIDGDHWKQQRKLVQPAFHAKRIQAYGDVMVNETRQLIDSWQIGQEYNLLHEMMKVTMAIISQTMFGADVKGQEDVISHALSVCLDTEMRQMQALFTTPKWLPTPRKIRFQRAIEMFDNLMYKFIRERRASSEDKGDLLSMLLMAADETHTMTDQEVRDEALTLFSAGHETTASALGWTWHLLAQHPEVEAKLAEEVQRVLGDRPPTLQDLRNLPYTDMVLKESMRLHPPAFAQLRESSEDVQIGGYTLPKGSLVAVCQHTLHRDPRFWEQPEQFRPERFAEGWEKQTPRYAYFPFGGGPRVCTGQALAMMEAQIILAMVVQRCRFSATPGQDIKPKIVFLQRPGEGLRATVHARR